MKLTDGQLAAYVAFGLMLMYEEQTLLQYMSEDELTKLVEDVNVFLCPMVGDGENLVAPLVNTLRSAMVNSIAQSLTKGLTNDGF